MNSSPIYYRPLNQDARNKMEGELWEESINLFKKNDYINSFYKFLDYLNKDIRKGKALTTFEIPHGSAIISITITESQIKVEAKVLKITDKTAKIPLMRTLCEINFNELSLANVRIKDDNVIFSYYFDYELSSPQKLYDVIWDICRYADKYDDEFRENFCTNFTKQPKVENFSSTQLSNALETVQKEVSLALSYFDEFEKDRNNSLKYFTIASTLCKLEFYLNPQGFLKTEFEREITSLFKSNEDLSHRIQRAKSFLINLKDGEKERITNNLYKIQILTPEKYNISRQNIQLNWRESFERVKQAMANNDYIFSTMDMLTSIYKMLSFNYCNDEISAPLLNVLEKVSGKSWKESAEELYDVLCFFMINDYVMKKHKKKGLLGRLFK